MLETRGLVQKLVLETGDEASVSGSQACVYVGPSPVDVEIFTLLRTTSDSAATTAFRSSMIDGITEAMAARREVIILHGESASTMEGLRLEGA
jgi:hypothetical protein